MLGKATYSQSWHLKSPDLQNRFKRPSLTHSRLTSLTSLEAEQLFIKSLL